MARGKLLLASLGLLGISIALVLEPANAIAAAPSNCQPAQLKAGTCPVSITPGIGNDGVTIGGTVTDRGGTRNPDGESATGPRGESGANAVCDPRVRICRDAYTVTTPTEGRGPITLADLVNFRPEVGVHRMEPSGWMVIGLDTNFYVETGAHVQNDLLLGQPASVRFTPVAYRWEYGDGTAASLGTNGASWRALGLREFDPTATSHVYTRPGTYVIEVTVDFRAEYTFGGAGWTSIEGTVPIPAAELTAVAGDADTVLVGRDCTIDARGPGC